MTLATVLAGLPWLVVGVRSAGAHNDRLRVVVCSQTATDQAFVARLRGQTVDLAIDLLAVPAALGRGPIEDQVQIAAALSRTHAARVVVWRSAREVYLYVTSPSPPHLLVRTVRDGPPTADDAVPDPAGAALDDASARPPPGASPARLSAGLESAAVIIRSALRAILDGGKVGAPRPDPRPAPTVSVPAAAPAAHHYFPDLSVFVLGDFRMASDGIGNSAPRGFGAHLGLEWRRLGAGVTGMTTLDRDVGTVIPQPFWRQNIALFVDADAIRLGRARLTAEVQAGRAYFNLYRSTGTVRQPHRLFGAEVRGSYDALTTRWFRVPAWLGVAADYIPEAPPLTMDPDNRVLWVTRTFQPRVMLGTGLEF